MHFLKKLLLPSNLGKYLLILAIVSLLPIGVSYLMTSLGLPENPTPADNLSQSQLILGYILVLTSVLSDVLVIVFKVLFLLTIINFIYQLIKKPKSVQSPRYNHTPRVI